MTWGGNMDYIGFFKDSIEESFESMFEEKLTLESEIPAPGCVSSKGVAIVVGITGKIKGRFLLDMCLDTAVELAKIFDPHSNDEDFALFSIAEFGNILSGGAITMINDKFKGTGLRLAPPSIFTGTNSKIFSPNLKAVLLSYTTRFGKIDFHIGFEGV